MQSFILVFVGGGLGSIVRYALGRWINTMHSQPFPWGTLVVNIVACFLLGVAVGLADHRHLFNTSARLFWTVGFCGGFSTFSTFSYETLALLQHGLTFEVCAYVAISLILCVAVTFMGIYVAQQV